MTDKARLVIEADATQVKKARGELNQFAQESGKTERAAKSLSDGFASMSGVLKTLVPLAGALSFASITGEMVRVARETENFKAQLKTMTGSMDAAGAAFDRLNEFAKTTPYTLQQSIEGFVKLKALGLDPSERAMRAYGNTASAMGKSMIDMIEAVADASTGENERLKSFGITASKAGEMVTYTFRGVDTTMKATSFSDT